MWAIIRTVVVFPFVPVTLMIGMRAETPDGKSESMTGRATYCGSPSVGWVCIRKPGAALTSTMAPPVSRTGVAMSGQMKSMPATSRPTIWAAVSAISTLSGWASIVRSIDVPPVDMLPVSASLTQVPSGSTSSSSKPWSRTSSSAAASTLIRVRTFSWPMPRRGSLFATSTSSRTVCSPSPVTLAGHALGDGRDLAADDEAAIVVAGHVRLDDDVAAAALGERAVERGPHGVLGAQVEVDAAAVVAVERLDHDREAEPVRDGDRAVLGVDDVGARDRQAGAVEQPVGQALVGRDVDADGARLRGHRGPDALLVDAVPELDQRVPVEADERDVAADRLVDEGLRRRPERLALGEADEPLELGREVEEDRRIVRRDEVVDEGDRHPAGLEADGLLAVLVDAVVLAELAGGPGLAVADVGAGEVLELERDVLGDVADPRPVAEPGDEPAAPAQASRRGPRGSG